MQRRNKLIVGLGNPGKDYEYTRHNLGFLVVRQLADRINASFRLSSFTNGLVAEGQAKYRNLNLLLPLTYMNNSGVAVKSVIAKKQLAIENILVVCDDLNLNFGQLRLKQKGRDGGHNGLKSIMRHLDSNQFARLRMGIIGDTNCGTAQAVKNRDTTDFVLGEFTKQESKQLENFISRAVDCCLVWQQEGTTKAMSEFNGKGT